MRYIVIVGYTHPKADYDRTSTTVSPLTTSDIQDLIAMRLEMKRVNDELCRASAIRRILESRAAEAAAAADEEFRRRKRDSISSIDSGSSASTCVASAPQTPQADSDFVFELMADSCQRKIQLQEDLEKGLQYAPAQTWAAKSQHPMQYAQKQATVSRPPFRVDFVEPAQTNIYPPTPPTLARTLSTRVPHPLPPHPRSAFATASIDHQQPTYNLPAPYPYDAFATYPNLPQQQMYAQQNVYMHPPQPQQVTGQQIAQQRAQQIMQARAAQQQAEMMRQKREWVERQAQFTAPPVVQQQVQPAVAPVGARNVGCVGSGRKATPLFLSGNDIWGAPVAAGSGFGGLY
ncbi:hypothetical protein HK101_008200 [Irineochytrium annulatum]|nr:hypothetical protein HK101_008200 [Irineochytrium annulatum]